MSETEYQRLEILNKHLLEANKDLGKEIERINNIINKAIEYIKVCKYNDMGIRYQTIEEILQGVDKE